MIMGIIHWPMKKKLIEFSHIQQSRYTYHKSTTVFFSVCNEAPWFKILYNLCLNVIAMIWVMLLVVIWTHFHWCYLYQNSTLAMLSECKCNKILVNHESYGLPVLQPKWLREGVIILSGGSRGWSIWAIVRGFSDL